MGSSLTVSAKAVGLRVTMIPKLIELYIVGSKLRITALLSLFKVILILLLALMQRFKKI